jgi:hypothetical protein
MVLHSPLSLRERVRVRGKSWIYGYCCPLIRPSATFSPRGEGFSGRLALIRFLNKLRLMAEKNKLQFCLLINVENIQA